MNTTNMATLITAITGCIGAITALIIAVWHVARHNPPPKAGPAKPPANPVPRRPASPGPPTPLPAVCRTTTTPPGQPR